LAHIAKWVYLLQLQVSIAEEILSSKNIKKSAGKSPALSIVIFFYFFVNLRVVIILPLSSVSLSIYRPADRLLMSTLTISLAG
jgi:hypothetical protein